MKRAIIVVIILAAAGGGYYYYSQQQSAAAASANAGQGGPGAQGGGGRQGGPGGGGGGFGGGGFGGPGGFGGGGGPRLPMTVELAAVTRGDMSQSISVVGNLIGALTVEAVPKVNGRLEAVAVRMGDRVSRGQLLAKIEDREILEHVKQA